MKNIHPVTLAALRLQRKRQSEPVDALAQFTPVGWCGGVAGMGETPLFFFGGDAVRHEKPVARDTIFRIASISKVFGAGAALLLVRQGKLSLDGDIGDVLGFSAGKPITLRQLLTHTASLDDTALYDDVLFTPEEMPLDALLPKSFTPHKPGTRFRYSNLGAGVVGMLVEAASGMLFDDFIRLTFFTSYGIDASFHPQRIAHQELMANCYYVPPGDLAYDAYAIARSPLDEVPNPRIHYNIPAGKLMISAPNLLDAFRRLPEQIPEMFVRQSHIGSVTCDAGRGLGIAIAEKGVFTKDRLYWGHQGQAYGAVCEAWIDLTDGTTAVLLTNGAKLGHQKPLYRVGRVGIASLLQKRA